MSKEENEQDFKINEICWAKLKGYPWWPALIKDIFFEKNKKYYFVGYFCEKNGSSLNINNIKKWNINYELFKAGGENLKKNNSKNDFLSALKVANMYNEGKINFKDHENFINKFTSNKDRHNLYYIETFFKGIIKEKIEKEKHINEKKMNNNKSKNTPKKLIGKKRKISKEKEKEKGKINEKEGKKSVIKDNEINMAQKELNKIDDLINIITFNVDQIMIKNEKYQKFFEQECKEKNISITDNKNIKTKIELIKYLQIINEILDIPISLNNMIQNINTKK